MKYSELNEQKQHGTADFPIEYYHVTERHPQYEMPLHWHKEFELVYVKSGSLRLYLNGMEYLLKPGDIVAVGGGTLHRGTPTDCVYECVVFDLNMLRGASGGADGLITPIVGGEVSCDAHFPSDGSLLYHSAEALFGAMRSPCQFYELEVQSRLFALFSELYKAGAIRPHEDKRPNLHTHLITGLLDWLEDHLCEHMTLADLSTMAGLNEKYFCRVFKESTGKTPIDYINSSRIDNACRLLVHEKKSVTEAAILSGFNDMSYFSKVFKKYKSCSPREWLKLNKQRPAGL